MFHCNLRSIQLSETFKLQPTLKNYFLVGIFKTFTFPKKKILWLAKNRYCHEFYWYFVMRVNKSHNGEAQIKNFSAPFKKCCNKYKYKSQRQKSECQYVINYLGYLIRKTFRTRKKSNKKPHKSITHTFRSYSIVQMKLFTFSSTL